jgi:hypothetical protein
VWCFSDPIQRADTGEQSTVIEVLQNAALLRDSFNFDNVLPNGKPDLNTFDLHDTFECPIGSVAVEDACGM